MKPFFQDDATTIWCGDMRKIVSKLGRVDAIITDPPYGETRLAWDRWPEGWPALLLDVAPQLWCFGSFRLFWDKRDEFAGWKLAQDIVWEKHNGSALHNDRFRRVHELAVHFYQGNWGGLYHKPVVTMDAQKRNILRQNKPAHWGQLAKPGRFKMEEGGPRLARSVMFCRSTHGMGEHPTQKPEAILRPLIEYSVPPGGTVLDPFMGSGTTLRVAKDLGRRAIGIDADKTWCQAAVRRLSQEVLLAG